jgi:hypothetical protein
LNIEVKIIEDDRLWVAIARVVQGDISASIRDTGASPK